MWRRFLKEAQITGQLEHPNIVPVYELGRRPQDNQPFYTMRFIRGRNLRQAIARHHEQRQGGKTDPLDMPKLLQAFVSVCQAIGYAHSRGVIHRDLKPENIVLGNFGEVLVLDWGLAKAVERPDDEQDLPGLSITADAVTNETVAGQSIGTPAYMAPEQADGRLDLMDERTDIYGLGAILFELLTGQAPHNGPSLPELVSQVVSGESPSASAVEPSVPAALNAICGKAMAKARGQRYSSATELADDVQRWLADEPVSAWREPPWTRIRRWTGRHKTMVTASCVGISVLVLAGVASLAQRIAAAHVRADALTKAEIRAVPDILRALGSDRHLVTGRLRRLTHASQPESVRLRAGLGLLADDPSMAKDLTDRVLQPQSTPDELIVVCDQLRPHVARARPRLEAALGSKLDTINDAQLRSAGMLASMRPDDPRWTALAGPIALKLTHENPIFVSGWREVFQPVAKLLAPPLRTIYFDVAHPERRALAFTLLMAFACRPENSARIEDLAALVGDSDPERLDQILDLIRSANDRAGMVRALTPQLEPIAQFDLVRSARQGRAAACVMRLATNESVWPLFRFQEDPTTRTELIHASVAFGAPLSPFIARVEVEKDVSVRRALILTIGSYPVSTFRESDRQTLIKTLLAWYRSDPDPGLHGAIAWVVGARWGHEDDLNRIDVEAARLPVPPGRGWCVNSQGQTYSIIRGPVEFVMGSSTDRDPNFQADEVQHLRRIPRSFAIAAREVMVSDYARFLDENPKEFDIRKSKEFFASTHPSPECPMGVFDYYDAAKYCNWLSAKDGLPESQWCYPTKIGPGMTLPADHLDRKGYRLPTEAEWEYSARSGTTSSRPCGGSTKLLSEYSWYLDNGARVFHPVGRLKPNDLGLFDILGNACERCADAYLPYQLPEDSLADRPDAPTVDVLVEKEFSDAILRIDRGGSYDSLPPQARSALRGKQRPTGRLVIIGLRPARTL